MNWRLKAIIQKTISFFPYSSRINFYAQRYLTNGRSLPRELIISRIKIAQKHLTNYKRFGESSIDEATILEIGTGWYPIVPISLFLSGANEIMTSDIQLLFNRASVNQTIIAFLKLEKDGELQKLLPSLQKSRIKDLKIALNERSITAKFNLLSIRFVYHDNESLSVLPDSIDLITSNNTLQFLNQIELTRLFIEAHRIGKRKALMSLAVDMTDEFSHSDSSIGNFNYLKYSRPRWKQITCKLNRTNRLRYSDFKKYYKNYAVLMEEKSSGKSSELNDIIIHNDFSHYQLVDILIKHYYCLLKKS